MSTTCSTERNAISAGTAPASGPIELGHQPESFAVSAQHGFERRRELLLAGPVRRGLDDDAPPVEGQGDLVAFVEVRGGHQIARQDEPEAVPDPLELLYHHAWIILTYNPNRNARFELRCFRPGRARRRAPPARPRPRSGTCRRCARP